MFSELTDLQMGVTAIYTPALCVHQFSSGSTSKLRDIKEARLKEGQWRYLTFTGDSIAKSFNERPLVGVPPPLRTFTAAWRTSRKSMRRWRRCTWWFRTRWRAPTAKAPGGTPRWLPGNLPEPTPCWSGGGREREWERGKENEIRDEMRKRKKEEEGIPHRLSTSSCNPPTRTLPLRHSSHTLKPIHSRSLCGIQLGLPPHCPSPSLTPVFRVALNNIGNLSPHAFLLWL